MDYKYIVYAVAAAVCAALIAFTTTPAVRVLAYKVGAIDIPEDDRRMHKTPTPRLGGLAIYLAFTLTTLIFSETNQTLVTVWLGGTVIVILGFLDDIFRLKAMVKFIVQIGVAFIAVWQGLTVNAITVAGATIEFGNWSILITVLWIVGLTNAINLIDGLDGLSCGVSAISSASLLLASIMLGESPETSVLIAILLGSCIGFLPFNANPAKIFMGDTGALFLGYTLSVLSVSGVLKSHTVFSFVVPLFVFALPILDTSFAFIRRIIHGKSPFSPDRGHLHHKLIDMGLNQKQTVAILYSICAILGLSAIMFTSEKVLNALAIIATGLVILVINFILLKNPDTKEQSAIDRMTSTGKTREAIQQIEKEDENKEN